VLINHDTRGALDAVVDLINTTPETESRDGLPDIPALRDFVDRNRVSGIGRLGEADLTAVRTVRERLAGVFAAASTQEAVTARNRSRRYCDSRTCGNRLHVAAYRARRRGAETLD